VAPSPRSTVRRDKDFVRNAISDSFVIRQFVELGAVRIKNVGLFTIPTTIDDQR
jgi:hypothetical protein